MGKLLQVEKDDLFESRYEPGALFGFQYVFRRIFITNYCPPETDYCTKS